MKIIQCNPSVLEGPGGAPNTERLGNQGQQVNSQERQGKAMLWVDNGMSWELLARRTTHKGRENKESKKTQKKTQKKTKENQFLHGEECVLEAPG